jgi:hypothetical protein
MSALGREEPYPNAVQAANITCAGILSHESAMNSGERMELPDWTFVPGDQPIIVDLDQRTRPPWGEQTQYSS